MRIALIRHDPWWDADGRAARRTRRRQRFVAAAAFLSSTVAVAAAATGWLLQLGLVPGLGSIPLVP